MIQPMTTPMEDARQTEAVLNAADRPPMHAGRLSCSAKPSSISFTDSNIRMCAMNTSFVVEGEDIEHCITTRERQTQLRFGNTTLRCHAVFHILHKNVPGCSSDSFLNGLDNDL